MDFRNSTDLDDAQLYALLLRHTLPYRHDRLTVRVRYSRGAEFSGTCYYRDARIMVNLGRRNHYPYTLGTNVAKAQTTKRGWFRETYSLTLANPSQLVLFVYLHELYHYLVKMAKRSPRLKEAMCDRFATRVLVDVYGCPLLRPNGKPAPRENWDFKDLDAFVDAAPKQPQMNLPFLGEIPVRILRPKATACRRAENATGPKPEPGN